MTKKKILLVVLLAFGLLFAKSNGDIGFRTGFFSLGSNNVSGHTGLYSASSDVLHFYTGDASHADGLNLQNYDSEFKNYSDERYLGAKTVYDYFNQYQVVVKAKDIWIYEATSYDDLHNNPKGYYDDNGTFVYEMDCVGFTEYMYETHGGVNPTPDDQESGVVGWPFLPDEQYQSSNMYFTEDPAPLPTNGAITFASNITFSPSQPVEDNWFYAYVNIRETTGRSFNGSINYTLQQIDQYGNAVGYPDEYQYYVSCSGSSTETESKSFLEYDPAKFRLTITIPESGESKSIEFDVIAAVPQLSISPSAHTRQWNGGSFSSSITKTGSSATATYQVSEKPSWITITNGNSGNIPGNISMSTGQYLTGAQRSGILKIYSAQGVFSGGSHYTNITVTQNAPDQNLVLSGSLNASTTYRAQNQISTNGATTIGSNANINFISGNSIVLKPGFIAKPNSGISFLARISNSKKNENHDAGKENLLEDSVSK